MDINRNQPVLDSKLPIEEICRRFPMDNCMISRHSRIKHMENEGYLSSSNYNKLSIDNKAAQSTCYQTDPQDHYSKSQSLLLAQSQDKQGEQGSPHLSDYSQSLSSSAYQPQQSVKGNPFIINQPYADSTSQENNFNRQIGHAKSNPQPEPRYSSFNPTNQRDYQNKPHESLSPMRVSNTLALRLSPERKYKMTEEARQMTVKSLDNPSSQNDNNNMYYDTLNPEHTRILSNDHLFINFLKTLVEIEKEIEDTKIDLAAQADFNIDDTYNFFENSNKTMLNTPDIKSGLNKMNIYPTDNELHLVISKYDSNRKDGINFIEFFDMLVPFEKEYRDMVEERHPKGPVSPISIFSSVTNNYLISLIKLIINSETRIESLRRDLSFSNGFDPIQLFTQLDQFNYGYLTTNDLVDYLKHEGVYKEFNEVSLLCIRLDKNRDGRISYEEFKYEVTAMK